MHEKVFDRLTRHVSRRGVMAGTVAGLAGLAPFAASARKAHVLDPCDRQDDCAKRLRCHRGRCRIRIGDHCDNRLPNRQCLRGFCATGKDSPRDTPVCQRRGGDFEKRHGD